MSEAGAITRVKISGASIYGTYDTAITIAGIFAFFGWALVVIGVFVVFGGLAASAPFNIIIAGIGIGIAAIGLLQVASGQIVRATAESADYSRQSLLLQIAIAQGRTEIDLRGQAFSAPRGETLAVAKRGEPGLGQGASDISKGLSDEAIAALQKAANQGYEVTFSPDKSSVTLSSGGFRTSFSSNQDIIQFARAMR